MRFLRRAAKLSHVLANRRYWPALMKGVAATTENAQFLRQQCFATLIDVGANKGQFAVAAHAANPRASIISFEPVKEAAAKFREVFKRVEGITLHELALGSVSGEAKIYVSHFNDETTMLSVGSDADTRIVRVETLDRMIDIKRTKKPILLKLDVQGYELEVLKGAENTLLAVDNLFVEVSFQSLGPKHAPAFEIVDFLRARGFLIAGVHNPVSFGPAISVADFHFRKIKCDT